ncbi:sugar isomerase domain-containing protein [Paenibacillus sp.]|uniref:sugar isomerase domain-containing protein n=1 Tax=Paenibacillus sp. TaxID=58172 RepID=UPI002D2946C2|nr:sugar isomerase domain-containing protein [Paenibacillus sp.]HZG55045.1 sugar isomerase domain-containing protein [Paenibacillus sp.]
MSLVRTYFDRLRSLVERIETSQAEPIARAAEAVSTAMSEGRCIHVYDTGHMLDSELINRAGGFAAFHALRVRFEVDDAVRDRPELAAKDRSLEGLAEFALRASKALPGDVLIIGSVSGKSALPVDLALAARRMGLYVIAMTSVTYSSMLKSDHSSGKRLFEAADLVLDNCAPPLDAMVEAPGLEAAICPASGIAAAAIMWAVTAQATENLLALGKPPSVLKSINYPGSDAFNQTMYRRYAETSL